MASALPLPLFSFLLSLLLLRLLAARAAGVVVTSEVKFENETKKRYRASSIGDCRYQC